MSETKALPSGESQDEFSLKNAEASFGPAGRSIGWYRWAAWFAEKCWKSGMLSTQIDSAEKAFTVLCKGDELGLPPFASWNVIYQTKAKRLAILSKGALAVVQSKASFGSYTERIEGTGEEMRGVAIAARKGQPPTIKEFSYKDAEAAGLLRKPRGRDGDSYDGPWQSYLKDMLLSRARGRVLDIAFAAELGGIPIEGVAEDIDVMEERRAQAPKGLKAASQPMLPPPRRDPLLDELSGATAAPAPQVEPEMLPPSAVSLVAPETLSERIAKSVDDAFPVGPIHETEVVQTATGVKMQTPQEKCPRCKARINAMGGCDVCGWPGEEDFR